MLKSSLNTIRRHAKYLTWGSRRLGVRHTFSSYARMLKDSHGLISISIPGIRSEIFLRPGTFDQAAFKQIFIDGEYDVELGSPRHIIDAGANIGLASIFFANRYPDAKIIAIEPEQANYNLLCRNVQSYPNIRTLKAGLWSHRTNLVIENPESKSTGFRVIESEDTTELQAYGITDIMEMLGTSFIDVIKMDVEGAERDIFLGSDSWIYNVRIILVETHDRHRPGCTAALEQATHGRGFVRSAVGEIVVLRSGVFSRS